MSYVIDRDEPVNRSHPLMRNLAARWMALRTNPYWGTTKLYDISRPGNGLHAAITGAIWRGAHGRPGGFGALDFDGTNDIVDCGSNALLDDAEPFTVSFWMYPRTLTNADMLVGKSVIGASGAWAFTVGTSSVLAFFKDYPGTDTSVTWPTISLNTWHHLVLTFGGISTNPSLWVDGVLATPTVVSTGSSPRSDAALSLQLGATSNSFDGLMDDVCFHRQRLFADAEARALYHETRLGSRQTLNWRRLRRYWPGEDAGGGGVTADAPPASANGVVPTPTTAKSVAVSPVVANAVVVTPTTSKSTAVAAVAANAIVVAPTTGKSASVSPVGGQGATTTPGVSKAAGVSPVTSTGAIPAVTTQKTASVSPVSGQGIVVVPTASTPDPVDALTLAQVKAIIRRRFRTDVADDFVAFRQRLDGWKDDPSLITSEARDYLISKARGGFAWAIDSTLTYHDVDEWVDGAIKRHLNFPTRLPWAGVDPLGCIRGRGDVFTIDPQDTGAKRRLRNASNALANLAGVADGTFMWAVGEVPTWTRYAYFQDMHEGNTVSGSPFDRTVNRDGRETTWYLNGGDHTLTQETTIRRLSDSATDVGTFVVRNYPGTRPLMYQGNSETSAGSGIYNVGSVLLIYRKLRFWHIFIRGFRGAVGARIFNRGSMLAFGKDNAPLGSSAESWVHGCDLRHHRGISLANEFADENPELVDAAYSARTVALTTNPSTVNIGIQVSAPNVRITHTVAEFSPATFPELESAAQSGANIVGYSEGLDLSSGASGFYGAMLRLGQTSNHAIIRGEGCDDVTLIDVEGVNRHHTGVLGYNINNWLLRRLRVGPFGQFRPTSANGIQLAGVQDSLLEDILVFDAGMGVPAWGIALVTNPTQPSDNETLRNTVRRFVLVDASLRLAYESGVNTNWDRIRDNAFSDGILLEISPNNTNVGAGGAVSYGANVSINLWDPAHPSRNGFGNTFTRLIGWRTDGSQNILSIQHTGSAHTMYTNAQATAALPWWVSCWFEDPLVSEVPVEGSGKFLIRPSSRGLTFLTPSDLLLLPLPVDRVLRDPLVGEFAPTRIQTGALVSLSRPATARIQPGRTTDPVTRL